jgi:hypothetical protein
LKELFNSPSKSKSQTFYFNTSEWLKNNFSSDKASAAISIVVPKPEMNKYGI